MAQVWLVEDNPAFQRATQLALRTLSAVSEVRAFRRCEDAIDLIAGGLAPIPEVILMDVGLPGIDGIEGIRRIKAIAPRVNLLVLTVFEEDEKIFRAVCAGACGYLLKSAPMKDVLEGVEQAMSGGSAMNPRIARRVLEMFSKMMPETRQDHGLNERETAVLECMSEGLVKKQMADRLGVNLHTLDYIVRCVYKKLHVNCQSAAVSVGIREGIIRKTGL